MSYAKYFPTRLTGWRRAVWPALLLLLFISMMLSIISGPMALSGVESVKSLIDKIFHTELSQLNDYETTIIWELRWPRTLLASVIGALLADRKSVV